MRQPAEEFAAICLQFDTVRFSRCASPDRRECSIAQAGCRRPPPRRPEGWEGAAGDAAARRSGAAPPAAARRNVAMPPRQSPRRLREGAAAFQISRTPHSVRRSRSRRRRDGESPVFRRFQDARAQRAPRRLRRQRHAATRDGAVRQMRAAPAKMSRSAQIEYHAAVARLAWFGTRR